MEKIVSPIWSKEGELAQNLVGEKERDMDVEPGMKSDTEVLISIPDVEMVQLCDVDKEGEQNIVIEPDLILLSDMNAETATHSESSEEQSSDDKEMSTAPFPAKQMLVKSSNKDASRKKVQVKEELMEEDCAIQNEGSRKQSGASSAVPLTNMSHQRSCYQCKNILGPNELSVQIVTYMTKEILLLCSRCSMDYHHQWSSTSEKKSYKSWTAASYLSNEDQQCSCDKCKNVEHVQIHPTETIDNVSCTICNKTFPDELTRYAHLMTHTTNYTWTVQNNLHTCDVCKKLFNDHSDLLVHRATSKNCNKCCICGTRFIGSRSLSIHMLRLHGSDGLCQCNICGKSPPGQHDLKVQERTSPDIQEYQNALSYISQLTNQKSPYACSVCGKKFMRHCNLKRHFKIVHIRL